jgi:hypothetical protein
MDLFGWSEETRKRARKADPETSYEAAASVRNVTETQNAIFEIIKKHGPISDESILFRLDTETALVVSPSGARSRRAELVAQKRVEFADDYGMTSSNRRTRLWRIVEA